MLHCTWFSFNSYPKKSVQYFKHMSITLTNLFAQLYIQWGGIAKRYQYYINKLVQVYSSNYAITSYSKTMKYTGEMENVFSELEDH